MSEFAVTLTRSARKDLEALPRSVYVRIVRHLEALGENQQPAGALKLHGNGGYWRLRVGDYRVIYSINAANCVVDIRAVRHRKDVYRKF